MNLITTLKNLFLGIRASDDDRAEVRQAGRDTGREFTQEYLNGFRESVIEEAMTFQREVSGMPVDYESMTIDELQEECTRQGIEFHPRNGSKKLITLLEG